MAKAMIKCPFCNRYVPLVQKGYKIYCPECGREITYSEKDSKYVSPPQRDSVSPESLGCGTYDKE